MRTTQSTLQEMYQSGEKSLRLPAMTRAFLPFLKMQGLMFYLLVIH